MKTTFKYLQVLSLLLFSVVVNAQDNLGQQSFEVVKNTTLEDVYVNSMIKPIALVKPENGSVSFSYSASGVYEMKFTPDADYIGSQYIVAEYYFNNGLPTPKYIHFFIEVKNSIIRAEADFANTDLNTSVSVFALDNDFASHPPLSITSASFVTDGSINLVNGDELVFTPALDFVGDAYVNYVVEDSLGYTKSGTIKVGVNDIQNVAAYDLIKIATTNKNPATILLPLSGFQVDPNNAPQNGTVDFVGTDVLEYTSSYGNANLDTFSVLLDSTYVRDIIVETIYIPEPNGFVIDDYVITTVGSAVTFDVQANDIKKNFPIVAYTQVPELVQDSIDKSVFTYTPSSTFEGEAVFSYTVTNGTYNETAYITVVVSDFTPDNNLIYNLSTPKNTPLVINYDIPISNFSFIENAAPIQGQLDIYEGVDTINIGCDEISGYNLVTYTPSTDYVGSDQFEILYCVDNSNCELVKVFVEVEDIGLDSICLCITDCVWAGDTDNDGKVSVADLLPIAYHQGLSGQVRTEAGSSSSWFGQHATDWNVNQVYDVNKDVKHVDSNGDGIIAGDDLFEITSYYNRFHDLISPDNLVIKDYPFVLSSEQDTVYAGELLELDISIGSEAYPAVGLHGLAYGLTFPADLIDSSTLAVDFLNHEWFGSNSAAMEMAVQPYEGRIEASFSRTSGIPVSGSGLVASVSFVIEDDLQGFKLDGDVIEFEIHMESMKVLGVGGQEFLLPPFKKTMYLDLRTDERAFDPAVDINLYPNPASQHVIMHANKGVEISEVQLFNMQGQLISVHNIGFQTARINISELESGIYFARIETLSGMSTKKFVVE